MTILTGSLVVLNPYLYLVNNINPRRMNEIGVIIKLQRCDCGEQLATVIWYNSQVEVLHTKYLVEYEEWYE